MPIQLVTLWEWASATHFLGSLGPTMGHSSWDIMASAYIFLVFSIPLTLEVHYAVLLGEGLPL